MANVLLILLEGNGLQQDSNGITYVEKYHIEDAASPEEAFDLLPPMGTIYTSYPNMRLINKRVDRVEAKDLYLATVTYGPPDTDEKQMPNEAGEIWEWILNPQTIHITSADEKLANAKVQEWTNLRKDTKPGNALSQKIRENKDQVDGTDVYRKTGALRVSKQYANKEDIGQAARQGFYAAQAHVNEAAWQDWEPEEILFLGATIKYGNETVTVDFNFIFGKIEDLKLDIFTSNYSEEEPEIITLEAVKPFDYIWQEPGVKTVRPNGLGTAGTKTIKGFINAKKAIVYGKTNFDNFGLVGP